MSTSRRAFLTGHSISGQGDLFHSTDPATGKTVWEGRAATEHDVKAAIASARAALPPWSDRPPDQRIALLTKFADELRARKVEMAEAISLETGKPLWEANTEVDAMAAKVAISVDAMNERRRSIVREQGGVVSATRYKPMGVMAVFGPFNMPGHLPNGHIVPALLAGNTVVFKPSELTPGVGERLAEMFHHAGIPAGVVNLLQGGREVGELLTQHRDIDGIAFTGSVAGGLAISKSVVEQPWKILALEMGGNNPLIVWDAANLDAAAYLTIQSAFITAGQRCSCARRLIVPDASRADAMIDRLVAMMKTIQVGPFTNKPEPFMGPIISDGAADRLLAARAELLSAGGVSLVEMKQVGERRAMLSPGLIDVSAIANRPDAELFGPMLQVVRVGDFEAALREANNTAYGLAAGLFGDDPSLWKRFYKEIRAGVVYWNRQITGGSSQLPFGGVGLSGNFRPSGYWAADYCSFPVASMQTPTLAMPTQKMPGIGA